MNGLRLRLTWWERLTLGVKMLGGVGTFLAGAATFIELVMHILK